MRKFILALLSSAALVVPASAQVFGVSPSGGGGAPGVGIANAAVNGSGHLILTKTDGSTVDAGVLPLATTIGIASAAINGSNHLILTKTDGSTADAGALPPTSTPATLVVGTATVVTGGAAGVQTLIAAGGAAAGGVFTNDGTSVCVGIGVTPTAPGGTTVGTCATGQYLYANTPYTLPGSTTAAQCSPVYIYTSDNGHQFTVTPYSSAPTTAACAGGGGSSSTIPAATLDGLDSLIQTAQVGEAAAYVTNPLGATMTLTDPSGLLSLSGNRLAVASALTGTTVGQVLNFTVTSSLAGKTTRTDPLSLTIASPPPGKQYTLAQVGATNVSYSNSFSTVAFSSPPFLQDGSANPNAVETGLYDFYPQFSPSYPITAANESTSFYENVGKRGLIGNTGETEVSGNPSVNGIPFPHTAEPGGGMRITATPLSSYGTPAAARLISAGFQYNSGVFSLSAPINMGGCVTARSYVRDVQGLWFAPIWLWGELQGYDAEMDVEMGWQNPPVAEGLTFFNHNAVYWAELASQDYNQVLYYKPGMSRALHTITRCIGTNEALVLMDGTLVQTLQTPPQYKIGSNPQFTVYGDLAVSNSGAVTSGVPASNDQTQFANGNAHAIIDYIKVTNAPSGAFTAGLPLGVPDRGQISYPGMSGTNVATGTGAQGYGEQPNALLTNWRFNDPALTCPNYRPDHGQSSGWPGFNSTGIANTSINNSVIAGYTVAVSIAAGNDSGSAPIQELSYTAPGTKGSLASLGVDQYCTVTYYKASNLALAKSGTTLNYSFAAATGSVTVDHYNIALWTNGNVVANATMSAAGSGTFTGTAGANYFISVTPVLSGTIGAAVAQIAYSATVAL